MGQAEDEGDAYHVDSEDPALQSRHEHERTSPDSAPARGASDEGRPTRRERPEWRQDLPGDQPGDRRGRNVERVGSGELGGQEDDSAEALEPEVIEDEVDRLLPTILAKIEQHLHLPIQPPDPDALAKLKREEPHVRHLQPVVVSAWSTVPRCAPSLGHH